MATYNGTHPANISKHLRQIADEGVGTGDAAALRQYADEIERLARAAGVKFLGDR